jgi:hypothetical protein
LTDAALPKSAPLKPAGAFSSWEVGLALRYLRAKKKEGGVALIAIISFFGIMLAVMALIVVLSIMSGFRSELLGRMLSFNGHMYVQGPVLTSPTATRRSPGSRPFPASSASARWSRRRLWFRRAARRPAPSCAACARKISVRCLTSRPASRPRPVRASARAHTAAIAS